MAQVAAISQQIWDMKYRLKGPDGAPVDKTIEDSWRRVAEALAEAEAPEVRAEWADRFYEALSGFKYLPAGRILAGAGAKRNVTLFNCFVMGTVPDDMSGIFEHLREAALTMQQGGGIGYDFSTLRPKGAPVKGVGADASGPLSFMDVWDAMCRTIMSAGHRRGAMMATLRCDHPDIENFIEAKQQPGRLRMFNLSVLVTDAFMLAVKEDGPWELKFNGTTFRVVRARALWDKIMHSTYAAAEPGVIFIDRINRANNLQYCETIQATNPCGEQPLPPYGACLLGSINLTTLIREPFTPNAHLDLDELDRLVRVAVRMMDNVVDVSNFPLPQQTHEARSKRRIGLGVTGLADALILCEARYGSARSVELTDQWMRALTRSAYLASVEIAKEKGPFPLFERDAYLNSEFVKTLAPDVQDAIAEHGIRNAAFAVGSIDDYPLRPLAFDVALFLAVWGKPLGGGRTVGAAHLRRILQATRRQLIIRVGVQKEPSKERRLAEILTLCDEEGFDALCFSRARDDSEVFTRGNLIVAHRRGTDARAGDLPPLALVPTEFGSSSDRRDRARRRIHLSRRRRAGPAAAADADRARRRCRAGRRARGDLQGLPRRTGVAQRVSVVPRAEARRPEGRLHRGRAPRLPPRHAEPRDDASPGRVAERPGHRGRRRVFRGA